MKTVTLPSLNEFAGVNRAILLSEAAAIHGTWLREAPEGYSNLTRKRLAPGLFVRAEDYVQAQRRRRELIAAVEAAFDGVDLLLTASSMDPACRIDDAEAVEITYPRQARTPFNVTGHPALTMMCGLSQAGRACRSPCNWSGASSTRRRSIAPPPPMNAPRPGRTSAPRCKARARTRP